MNFGLFLIHLSSKHPFQVKFCRFITDFIKKICISAIFFVTLRSNYVHVYVNICTCVQYSLSSRRNGNMSFRGVAKRHKRRLLTLFATFQNLRNIRLMVVAVSNECPRDMLLHPPMRYAYSGLAYSA